MEQDRNHDVGQVSSAPSVPVAAVPTLDNPQPTPVADTSRHRYTMTVEDVASQLHQHGLDRDSRTIQRWCKSGKLDAIIDHANGERWLIDPVSANQVIDDILAEVSRRGRYVPRPDPTMSRRRLSVATSRGAGSRECNFAG